MVAQASREQLPEEFSLSASPWQGAGQRAPFRVAVYGPLRAAPARREERTWQQALAPATLAG